MQEFCDTFFLSLVPSKLTFQVMEKNMFKHHNHVISMASVLKCINKAQILLKASENYVKWCQEKN